MDTFRIRSACTHDFKNIDLDLPRDRLIVLKGISVGKILSPLRHHLRRRTAATWSRCRPNGFVKREFFRIEK
uniref:Uncharacterized protein n=1 Tax=Candidatus Kentrum sp. UNK TaxID=2126344 RepID=A0A451B2H7_9GAMM|nr:MAG: hypothetical protein BECKUNK1418G_GA0071005_112010 [Candidatus Kentron sp. UNK]VFK72477.1 MAG: hypothetical protein BECKUNK1418H_GA0071006_111710 [Candidatus Kentron sp. UNK]